MCCGSGGDCLDDHWEAEVIEVPEMCREGTVRRCRDDGEQSKKQNQKVNSPAEKPLVAVFSAHRPRL